MIKDKFNLKGKRGIITGASRGIGRGMAEGLAGMGADIVIAARDMEKLEKAAREMSEYGGKVIPVQTDVGVDSDLIRINGIGPGFCETDMTEGVRKQQDRYDFLTSRMALGRWGKPDDFAGAAVFFVSDASGYITGTTLYVDGGFLSM